MVIETLTSVESSLGDSPTNPGLDVLSRLMGYRGKVDHRVGRTTEGVEQLFCPALADLVDPVLLSPDGDGKRNECAGCEQRSSIDACEARSGIQNSFGDAADGFAVPALPCRPSAAPDLAGTGVGDG
jgi:hypothetical protein